MSRDEGLSGVPIDAVRAVNKGLDGLSAAEAREMGEIYGQIWEPVPELQRRRLAQVIALIKADRPVPANELRALREVVKAGVEDREILGIIENQIRVPDKTLGDIRAQISSLGVGTERLARLFGRYGRTVVEGAWADLLDYSERRMRQGLRDVPDGTYSAEDYIDDDGINDRPIKVAIDVTIDGDRAAIDLTGSDPQAEGNTNSTAANTHAAIYYVMIAVIDPHAPPNSGCYRPIEVVTRPGSVVDPEPPGAVAARTNCSQKIVEGMFQALAPVLPDRVTAGSHGQISTCGIGGIDPATGERFIYTDIQGGGNGARPTKDGADGQDSHLPRFMNTPVEAVESRFPLRIVGLQTGFPL